MVDGDGSAGAAEPVSPWSVALLVLSALILVVGIVVYLLLP